MRSFIYFNTQHLVSTDIPPPLSVCKVGKLKRRWWHCDANAGSGQTKPVWPSPPSRPRLALLAENRVNHYAAYLQEFKAKALAQSDHNASLVDEYSWYIKEKAVWVQEPVASWLLQKHRYPNLSQIALDILSISCISAYAEPYCPVVVLLSKIVGATWRIWVDPEGFYLLRGHYFGAIKACLFYALRCVLRSASSTSRCR